MLQDRRNKKYAFEATGIRTARKGCRRAPEASTAGLV